MEGPWLFTAIDSSDFDLCCCQKTAWGCFGLSSHDQREGNLFMNYKHMLFKHGLTDNVLLHILYFKPTTILSLF